jgi:ParB/RepB/Spo0J family partition protein
MSEQKVLISSIVDAGDNVRHEIGDVTELAESIKRFGILQPLVVVPNGDEFIMAAGHRRLAAAKLAGLRKVPVVLRDLDPAERVDAMLSENIHRKNLTVLEEAVAFRRIMQRDGLSQTQLGERLGIAQTVVSNRLMFFKLPARVQRDVLEGSIGLQRALNEHARVPRPRGKTNKPWQERKAVLLGNEVPPRVFVLIAFGNTRRPESVQVLADRERAFNMRDELARNGDVLIFPCEVDMTEGSIDVTLQALVEAGA